MTPRDTRDEAKLRELACAIIDAIPGLMGMTPDPWPQEPAASCPHSQDVVDGVVALLRAPETQDGPSRDFLLAENARLKAALKERGEADECVCGHARVLHDIGTGKCYGRGSMPGASCGCYVQPSPPAQTEDSK